MSKCNCKTPKTVRVSDEGIYNSDMVRLRCMGCGGKAGFLSLDELERLAPNLDVKAFSEADGLYPTLAMNLYLQTDPASLSQNK